VCGWQRSTQKHVDDDQIEGAAGHTVTEIQNFSYIFVQEKRFLLTFFFFTAFRNKFSPCIILHPKGIYGSYLLYGALNRRASETVNLLSPCCQNCIKITQQYARTRTALFTTYCFISLIIHLMLQIIRQLFKILANALGFQT